MPLSTIRFVREIVHQQRARQRLRDLLVLLARAAAILLLALAIARPQEGARQRLLPPTGQSDEARIIVLDVSQSMDAAPRGVRLLDQARARASRLLHFQPNTTANLILAGASSRAVFERLSPNFAALRAELDQVRTLPERLNVLSSLRLTASLLADVDPAARREVVVLSDFQRSNWSGVDFAALPEGTQLRLESVAPEETSTNVGIVNIRASGRCRIGEPLGINVEMNHSGAVAIPVRIELTWDNLTQTTEQVCAPSARSQVTFEVVPRHEGWLEGQVRLLGARDALEADNTKVFVARARTAPEYILITRQPALQRPSSSHYIERALAPSVKPMEKVTRVDPAQLGFARLPDTELVVLDHPGKLTNSALSWLSGHLRQGGGVLYFLAEPIDARNIQEWQTLARKEWRPPVTFLPAAREQTRTGLFLAEVRRQAPPFAALAEDLGKLISPLRFTTNVVARRQPEGLAEEILATYSDRSPCLVISPFGGGNLALFNGDLSHSNLPTSAAFVPLVGELTSMLIKHQGIEPPAPCGEAGVWVLPAEVDNITHLTVENANRHQDAAENTNWGEFTKTAEGVWWRWPKVGPPGVYRVQRAGKTAFALATTIPTEESDLVTLAPDLLQSRIMSSTSIQAQRVEQTIETMDDRWMWAIVACIFCIFLEFFVLKWYRI